MGAMKHMAITADEIRGNEPAAGRSLAYAVRPGGMTPGGLTLGEVARALGVPVAVVVRLLRVNDN